MNPSRIVFAGTPDFAVPCLEALIVAGNSPVAVYTQPDRPAGRGRVVRHGPVKACALKHGIEVLQPESLRNPEAQKALAELKPGLMIVVAYGLILPQVVLDTPTLGCINVHASMLPRWRGAAPIQRAILAGDQRSGVTLMQMEAGLDTGPLLASAECNLEHGLSGGELHDRLSVMGADLLTAKLPDLLARKLTAKAQNDELANYAAKLEKAEAELDWSHPAEELMRKVLAFNPWPVAFTRYQGENLRIWRARKVDEKSNATPGTVVSESPEGLDVACGEGVLRITELQLPGKKPVSAAQFVNAHSLRNGPLGTS